MKSLLTAVTTTLLLAACGPGLEITDPGRDDVKVTRNPDGTLEVSLVAWGWDLRPAGACADRDACGHLHANVFTETKTGDHSWVGQGCGPAQEFEATQLRLDLSGCSRQDGLFALSVTLANDDHLLLEGSGVHAYRRFIVNP